MKQYNATVFATASGASNATSSVIDAFGFTSATFQGVTTSTLNGSFQVQGSNDPNSGGLPSSKFVPTNWSNVGSAVTAASAGVFITAVIPTCYRWLQCVYTNSSGTGNVTMTANLLGPA